MASDTATQNVGRITQVIGSTFDAQFDEDKLPDIYNAVEIDLGENGILTGEVQQHLGGGRVRCVALGSTDGMVRGQDCSDTGSPVSVPVVHWTESLTCGKPVDGRGEVKAEGYHL